MSTWQDYEILQKELNYELELEIVRESPNTTRAIVTMQG